MLRFVRIATIPPTHGCCTLVLLIMYFKFHVFLKVQIVRFYQWDKFFLVIHS
nr:MAG TPA: hypothetical protein [Caudoviricetes sp.]